MARLSMRVDAILPGDTLVDIDSGYVSETETAQDTFAFLGAYMGALPSEMTAITFHDADGNENYLLLNDDMTLTVERD